LILAKATRTRRISDDASQRWSARISKMSAKKYNVWLVRNPEEAVFLQRTVSTDLHCQAASRSQKFSAQEF
jgi:hypothetical protein